MQVLQSTCRQSFGTTCAPALYRYLNVLFGNFLVDAVVNSYSNDWVYVSRQFSPKNTRVTVQSVLHVTCLKRLSTCASVPVWLIDCYSVGGRDVMIHFFPFSKTLHARHKVTHNNLVLKEYFERVYSSLLCESRRFFVSSFTPFIPKDATRLPCALHKTYACTILSVETEKRSFFVNETCYILISFHRFFTWSSPVNVFKKGRFHKVCSLK